MNSSVSMPAAPTSMRSVFLTKADELDAST